MPWVVDGVIWEKHIKETIGGRKTEEIKTSDKVKNSKSSVTVDLRHQNHIYLTPTQNRN